MIAKIEKILWLESSSKIGRENNISVTIQLSLDNFDPNQDFNMGTSKLVNCNSFEML